MDRMRIIGVLSGTSMDGISLGLFEFNPQNTISTIAHTTANLPAEYKNEILNIIQSGSCSLDRLGQLDRWVGELFAAAILQFMAENNIAKESITAIGSHGQTIWHAPKAQYPFTMQIGDPNVIAVKTGITTVADFRRADLAAGGQGAPLAPAFHLAMLTNPDESRCIVNIGGFSNISILEQNNFRGFDSGPGNCLMDHWVQENFHMPYDAGGQLAASGKLNQNLLNIMLTDPYFKQAAPKSTGREYFNPAWLQAKINACNEQISALNVLTTLLHLTAESIALAIKQQAKPNAKVFICGGGAHNKELLTQLSTLLEQAVQTTDVLGFNPDCVEAALFAWLAQQRLLKIPVNLCAVTGVQHPVLLGAIIN